LESGGQKLCFVSKVEPELLQEAQKVLSEHPEHFWSEENPDRVDPAWMRAASVMSVHLKG